MKPDSARNPKLATAQFFEKWQPYDQIIRETASNYKYIVFFGCGAIFASIVDTWQSQVGLKIDFCCDNNPEKWGRNFNGVPCISYQDLLEIKDETIVFITVGNFIPVHNQLTADGFPSLHILYKYDLEAAPYIRLSDRLKISESADQARELLKDDKSRQIFDTILERSSGLNKSISLMPDIYEGHQYFPSDLIKLSANETYVDVGAYDGDTVKQFLQACHNQFEHIHAIELDKANFEKLDQDMRLSPHSQKIKTHNIAAWHKKEQISFQPGLTQSTVGSGESHAQAMPLDDVLRNESLTYIKMDIEGAEINALHGAREIITKNRPKLAICVYHKISHLWEIPLLIHEMLPEHDLYLRHHTRLEYETVCYALPKAELI